MRLKRLATAALLLASAPAAAEDAEPGYAGTSFRDWRAISGGEPKSCVLTSQVLLKENRTPLVTVVVTPMSGDAATEAAGDVAAPRAIITMQVPNGASLVSGIAYTHRRGNEAVGLAWQYCTADICVASGPVSQAEIDRLRREREITVGYRPLPGSRALAVPVSLMGFSAAWRETTSCME